MLRVASPLDDETEKCIDEAMDCGFAVHRALGPGFGIATVPSELIAWI